MNKELNYGNIYEPINDDEFEKDNPNNLKIGHKDASVYVLFALNQILNSNNEVTLNARGHIVQKAISVAMLLKKNYVKDLKIVTEIDSILMDNNFDNTKNFVPSIRIRLFKSDK
jgi:DNA-binding protein Alba